MQRRTLIKALSVTGFMAVGSGSVMRQLMHSASSVTADSQPQPGLTPPQDEPGVSPPPSTEELAQHEPVLEDMPPEHLVAQQQQAPPTQENPAQPDHAGSHPAKPHDSQKTLSGEQAKQAYLDKIRNFEKDYPDDFYLAQDQLSLLESTVKHLERVQRTIGHGNFNLVSFDQMLKYARNFSQIGQFSKQELDFLEQIFFAEASRYGFFGDKVITNLTAKIPSRDVIKVPHSGHYLYRGGSQNLYERLRRDVGDSMILTSGIRGVVKQMHLFLVKAVTARGNLSKASRSLAPPGHSYHGIGDFDIGKVGFGYRNFTADFAATEEFKRLQQLGYIAIRYTDDNDFGVRYEPWHIQVI